MRLIDADAANVDRISCYYGDRAYLDDVQEWLNEQPTVDPIKHGKWLFVHTYEGRKSGKCSVCERIRLAENYCPFCGAKMDLK